MSLRIPASLTIVATLTKKGWRETSLHVAGIENRELQQLLADGAAIGRKEIVAWFGLGWLSPSDDQLQKLECALNVMRAIPTTEDAAAIVQANVKGSISALIRDLPVLVELQQQDRQMAPTTPGAVSHGLTVQRVFDDLLTAAQQADKFLGRRRQRVRVAAWFPDALWIATYLRMLGEKAEKKVGLTKAESPAGRFISCALKRVWPSEPITPDNIARAMSRHQDLIEPWRPPVEGV
jgi:hypothetical protein